MQCYTGTRPPRSGTRPPRSLRPGGSGALGETFPSVPKIRKLSETHKGARPPILQLALVKGGSHTPPPKIGGLLNALHDFPNFSLKKQKFNFNCCLVSILAY